MSKSNQSQKNLIILADSYEKAFFDHFPEVGLMLGRNDVALDRFMDHSLAAHLAWQKNEDDFLAKLTKIKEADLKGSSAHVTYLLLKESLESSRDARVCREELWSVNPLWGWHNMVSVIAEKQPVGTAEFRSSAIKRWRSIPTLVDDEIDKLKIGLKEGYTAPKPAVDRVIKQLKIILATSTGESPFFDLANRDGNEKFKKQIAEIIEKDINPAMKRYAKYLEEDYSPKARNIIGVSALPKGGQCYSAMVRKETTLSISPKEIHEYGLAHMRQLEAEIAEIGQRQFGMQEMSEVFRQAKTSPHFLFQTEEEILAYNQSALDRAKMKISAWFDLMPKAKGVIKPYPAHRAKTGAPGEYHPPSDDGSRPGIFYINTFEPNKKSRIDQEATLFHELIPGHHFQVSLAHEDKTHHSLDKYLWNAGFGEGWALYVERLADEMGLYSDDISRLGMLSNEALRTARLVVDPGIHVMGWSREQAIQYLKEHTAMDENIIEGEVDRYSMLPGQATAYMLGKREIESLREKAKNTLQKDFDIRQYHNQVLKNGSVTLPMLRSQIEDWLDNRA